MIRFESKGENYCDGDYLNIVLAHSFMLMFKSPSQCFCLLIYNPENCFQLFLLVTNLYFHYYHHGGVLYMAENTLKKRSVIRPISS